MTTAARVLVATLRPRRARGHAVRARRRGALALVERAVPGAPPAGLEARLSRPRATHARARSLTRVAVDQGYQKVTGIMRLDDINRGQQVARLAPDASAYQKAQAESFGSGNYFVAFFGDPRRDARWGWLIQGHHLGVSFTVADGRTAFLPISSARRRWPSRRMSRPDGPRWRKKWQRRRAAGLADRHPARDGALAGRGARRRAERRGPETAFHAERGVVRGRDDARAEALAARARRGVCRERRFRRCRRAARGDRSGGLDELRSRGAATWKGTPPNRSTTECKGRASSSSCATRRTMCIRSRATPPTTMVRRGSA